MDIILFDKGVRNEVGGGQAMLLTDYHCFTSLYAATLQDDGIEYHKGRRRGGSDKPKGKSACFNSQNGCRFTEANGNTLVGPIIVINQSAQLNKSPQIQNDDMTDIQEIDLQLFVFFG